MRLFKHKEKEEYFLSPDGDKFFAISDGNTYTGNKDTLEEIKQVIESKLVTKDFKRYHITEETATLEKFKEWHLKDILFVPIDGKEVAFRVEHITDEKIYFVAIDAVGESSMTNMNDYLDAYLAKMPESLVNIMCEIEHCADGNLVRRSKLTLLSRKNVKDSEFKYELNGADDILFDGLQTEAECCKNLDGEAVYYWLDTPTSSPNADNSTHFMNVNNNGNPYYGYGASYAFAVVPCFSIYRQDKRKC